MSTKIYKNWNYTSPLYHHNYNIACFSFFLHVRRGIQNDNVLVNQTVASTHRIRRQMVYKFPYIADYMVISDLFCSFQWRLTVTLPECVYFCVLFASATVLYMESGSCQQSPHACNRCVCERTHQTFGVRDRQLLILNHCTGGSTNASEFGILVQFRQKRNQSR